MTAHRGHPMTSEPGVDAGLVEVLAAHERAGAWSCTCGYDYFQELRLFGDHAFTTHLARAVQAYTEQRADERVAAALEAAAVAIEASFAAYDTAARIVREQAPTTGGGS